VNIINPKHQIGFKNLLVELNQVKTSGFTGNVIVRVTGTPSWMLSFTAGRLAAIGGGIDAIGRWTRNLAIASLNAPPELLVKSPNREEIFLNSNKFAQEWAVKEVLFDIIQLSQHQGDRLTCQVIPTNSNVAGSNSSLPLLDLQPLLQETIHAWKEWQGKGLTAYSPSLFPTIQNAAQIASCEHIEEIQYLLDSIDGSRSLRGLAIHHQQKLIDFTITILPFLKTGAIVLVSNLKSNSEVVSVAQIKSDPAEDKQSTIRDLTNNLSATNSATLPPTIACIDDSILVYKNLEKILINGGYRCYGVQDPLKIIPALIKNKPDLIFLDLVMPVTNGYEVCEQIRKTPSLANIPVVILTGSDGLIDRVRSKFVGANGFIGKPATAESVHKALDKYLDKKPVVAASKPLRAKKVESNRIEVVEQRSKRVLVVDDDTNIREVVSVCLRKLKGWDTLTVGSGQEGLNSIGTYQPDAIVLDMMMPLMDGMTFLRLLRSDPTTKLIPVVLMTANLYLPGKQLLTELGVVDIISKPFVPVNLVKQIDRVFA
jgi:two-component system, chemotaxis family, response regulator PixG